MFTCGFKETTPWAYTRVSQNEIPDSGDLNFTPGGSAFGTYFWELWLGGPPLLRLLACSWRRFWGATGQEYWAFGTCDRGFGHLLYTFSLKGSHVGVSHSQFGPLLDPFWRGTFGDLGGFTALVEQGV